MRARLIAVLAVMSLVAVACSNASDDKDSSDTTTTSRGSSTNTPAGDQPGVTADTIRVGGVVSKTNPINGPYASAFDGVKAYFDMVNSAGGVHGKQLELVAERDDKIAQNQQEVEALLAQDNVFAVAPVATILAFSGADQLAREGVPTFGWNLNTEWTGQKNMFGSNFGALCLGCAGSGQPFLAKELGLKKVGVIAYNVENSAKCADGIEESFEKYPTADVVFVSKSKAFGDSDFSVEVSQMKDEGVDFVQTCMDTNAVVNLAKEMRRQGLDAVQYLPNGYDHELVEANAEFLEGSLTGTQFAPFETRPKPKGLTEFQRWMKKGNYTENEVAVMGWLAAAQLVEGIRLAGPNFTRQSVVDELNKLTDYTADGFIPPRNWTTEHDLEEGPVDNSVVCQAYLEVKDGKLTPTFTQPGKPFMCLPARPAKLPAKATFK